MRVVAKYQPEVDLMERWPHWRVMEATYLPRGVYEWFDVDGRVILVVSEKHGWEWARAHALAHLDLGHHETAGASFTTAMEADADLLASIRLDLLQWREADEWDDVPMDGEPSLTP